MSGRPVADHDGGGLVCTVCQSHIVEHDRADRFHRIEYVAADGDLVAAIVIHQDGDAEWETVAFECSNEQCRTVHRLPEGLVVDWT